MDSLFALEAVETVLDGKGLVAALDGCGTVAVAAHGAAAAVFTVLAVFAVGARIALFAVVDGERELAALDGCGTVAVAAHGAAVAVDTIFAVLAVDAVYAVLAVVHGADGVTVAYNRVAAGVFQQVGMAAQVHGVRSVHNFPFAFGTGVHLACFLDEGHLPFVVLGTVEAVEAVGDGVDIVLVYVNDIVAASGDAQNGSAAKQCGKNVFGIHDF